MNYVRRINLQGKELYLYFDLNLTEDRKSNENFQQFFAYSLLIERYILVINDYVSTGSKKKRIPVFLPCLLKPIDELNGIERSPERIMSYMLWDSFVYDLIKVQHWNMVDKLSEMTKLYGDGSTFWTRHWTRQESPVLNLDLPVLPEGMKYNMSYLEAKLAEMQSHRYMILEYMLQTFLSD